MTNNLQIRSAGLHFIQRISSVDGGEFHFHQWVLGAKQIQDRRQMTLGGVHRTEQPKFAAERRALLYEAVAQLLVLQ